MKEGEVPRDASLAGYHTQLITIEQGSHGMSDLRGLSLLKSALCLSSFVFRTLSIEMARQALFGSYGILCCRNKLS